MTLHFYLLTYLPSWGGWEGSKVSLTFHVFVSTLFSFLFFFPQRESMCTCKQGRGQGEREMPKQGPHSAQIPTWGLVPRPWELDLSCKHELDAQCSAPGAPCTRSSHSWHRRPLHLSLLREEKEWAACLCSQELLRTFFVGVKGLGLA